MVIAAHLESRRRIVGQSEVMRDLAERAKRAAESDLPVLICGETGSGKELLARSIHEASGRSDGPFVGEACGSLTESLLEAELFGHEAGAYTGAGHARAGLFERADGGTLFIDEIGDTSPSMQAKLLRVLQEGEVRRVGGERSTPVNVRVVASTQKDLCALVREGEFRRDLMFRVAVIELRVPPLRERREDIPLIAQHVLARVARLEQRPGLRLSVAAIERLVSHDWPGNVRELENAVHVGALFSSSEVIDAKHLSLADSPHLKSQLPRERLCKSGYDGLLADLSAQERAFVEQVLSDCKGNKAHAARTLGVTRYALYRTLKRLGLESPEREPVGV
jgi:two-component system response regulator HydG